MYVYVWYTILVNFYPRSPCGERLDYYALQYVLAYISIHALLAESDAAFCQAVPPKLYFYPRSPCGERPLAPEENPTQKRISIHALLAESDVDYYALQYDLANISIHALLAESDRYRIKAR